MLNNLLSAMKNTHLTIVKSQLMAQFSTAEYCLCRHDHFVLRYDYQSKKLAKVCQIPANGSGLLSKVKDKIRRHAIARYLSNSLGLGHISQLASGTIIIIYDKIYRYPATSTNGIAQVVCTLAKDNILPPLRNGIAIHPVSNNAYFGEYVNNAKRPIRIIRLSDDGQTAAVCFQFNQGEIKHVHGIYWDKYRQRLWITTGDSNE